jgi:chromosome segregation ATPase
MTEYQVTVRTVHHRDPLRLQAAQLCDEARDEIERLNSELAGVREALANESEARDDAEATAAMRLRLLDGTVSKVAGERAQGVRVEAELSRANDALERSLAEKETLRHQLDAARAVADRAVVIPRTWLDEKDIRNYLPTLADEARANKAARKALGS